MVWPFMVMIISINLDSGYTLNGNCLDEYLIES